MSVYIVLSFLILNVMIQHGVLVFFFFIHFNNILMANGLGLKHINQETNCPKPSVRDFVTFPA